MVKKLINLMYVILFSSVIVSSYIIVKHIYKNKIVSEALDKQECDDACTSTLEEFPDRDVMYNVSLEIYGNTSKLF